MVPTDAKQELFVASKLALISKNKVTVENVDRKLMSSLRRKLNNVLFCHPLLHARDWQHRPQLDDVCQWWRNGGRGVLALVGMGGAGKTAIAERFLRVLPSGLPTDPDVPKDDSLPNPHGVLVFSFYDAPNPEAFFESLQMWLEQTPQVKALLSLEQMFFRLQQIKGLLVLDGLERVQEDGMRGLLGRLASPKLREFLDRIAGGLFEGLSVLLTSRFPLADLRDARRQFFRSVPIDEIELPAGIRLLRARGVRGTDPQLAGIAVACGRHALTIDFAGGYIAEFGGADPATPVDFEMDSARLRQRCDEEPDEARRRVLKQGHRFARLAERYRDAMGGSKLAGSEGDAAALALLQRICLFRLGVSAEMLANIFTGEKAVKISGRALTGLNWSQLQKKLDWLVRMRIVESQAVTPNPKSRTSNLKSQLRYCIHPAVRDGFLCGICDETLRENHEAVCRGLEVSLGETPRNSPSDPATLDLLEEVVHHTLESGHVSEAWDIYKSRLGGCHNIIARLNDYNRAIRITRSVLCKGRRELSDHETIVLHNDIGYSQLQLGCVADAYETLFVGFTLCQRRNDANLRTLGRNLATTQKLLGRLGPAIETWQLLASKARDPQSHLEAIVEIAEIGILRGCVKRTIHETSMCDSGLPGFGEFVRDRFPVTIESPLVAPISNRAEYLKYIAFLENEYPNGNFELASTLLAFADCLTRIAEFESASELVIRSRNWAVDHDAKEILCWSALIQARIELARRSKGFQPVMSHNDSCSRVSAKLAGGACHDVLRDGLKIARDCGYGIYHIDLLIERARLQLLSGQPQAGLDDLRTALDDGILANEQTGQPELPAAMHPECGYAWAIADGLSLRGEALLQQAAQTLGQSTLVPIHRARLPAAVRDLIAQAEACLDESLNRWQALHHSEPESHDENFQLDGKQYNYRAAETHRILTALSGGVLTINPLSALSDSKLSPPNQLAPTGTAQVNGLIKVSGCEQSNRQADVVFVHGLDGDARSTWMADGKPENFWPEWLGSEFPNVGVWSLGYAVSASAWKGHSMPLTDRATNTLDLFDLDGIGKRRVMFICHSLGGLLVKQILRHACDSSDPRWQAVLKQTRQIVFLSTPHSGADMANWLKHIGGLLRSTVSVQELEAHHPQLRNLNEWYRDRVSGLGIKTFVYCEKLATKGVMVVNETTADPGISGVRPVPMDDDHMTICKPRTRDSQVYRRVKQLLQENVLNPFMDSPDWDRRTPLSQNTPTSSAVHIAPARLAADFTPFPPSKLPPTGRYLIGREQDLYRMTQAWESPETNLLQIVAMGGVGKTQLVKKWRERLLGGKDHGGATRAFDWSFYNQGTQKEASSDEFCDQALRWIGESDPQRFHDPWHKGARLAELLRQHRTLLILDGLEPLQHPQGMLSDQAIRALLRGLAHDNPGLCIVTTREPVPELEELDEPRRITIPLRPLAACHGAELLRHFGVRGEQQELERASTDYEGHPLVLILLGTYIRDRLRGDIRERNRVTWPPGFDDDSLPLLDTVDLEKAEVKFVRHARKLVASYLNWFESELEYDEPSQKNVARAAVAILKLMGLFNRPADEACLHALRQKPINDLTEPLFEAEDRDELWQQAVLRLQQARLLADHPSYDKSPLPIHRLPLDSHPLVREYMSYYLSKRHAGASREAHLRLFKHLEQTASSVPNSLNEMMPLYHAVEHGCKADRRAEAFTSIYLSRILRDERFPFSLHKLGAYGADLCALSHLFTRHWDRPHESLEALKGKLLLLVGHILRSLNRMEHAHSAFEAGLRETLGSDPPQWEYAAIICGNHAELLTVQGNFSRAVSIARHGVILADRGVDVVWQVFNRTILADALRLAGRIGAAKAAFEDAFRLERQVLNPEKTNYFRDSLTTFRFAETRLDEIHFETLAESGCGAPSDPSRSDASHRLREIRDDLERRLQVPDGQRQTLWAPALERAAHARALLMGLPRASKGMLPAAFSELTLAEAELDESVSFLRQAGAQHWLPCALLYRSWLWRVKAGILHDGDGRRSGLFSRAHEDLSDLEQIAERGSMLIWQIEGVVERVKLAIAREDRAGAWKLLDQAQHLLSRTETCYAVEESETAGLLGFELERVFENGEKVGYHRRRRDIEVLKEYLNR